MVRRHRVRDHTRSTGSRVREHTRGSDDPRDMLVKRSKVKVQYAPLPPPPEGWHSEDPSFYSDGDTVIEAHYELEADPVAMKWPRFNYVDENDYGGFNSAYMTKTKGDPMWDLYVDHGDPERRSSMAYRSIQYWAQYKSPEEAVKALRSGKFWDKAEEVGWG